MAFFRRRTSHAHARARGIAADAVHAIARHALRIQRARRAIGQIARNGASRCAVAFAIRTFVLGIRTVHDKPAGAIGALAFFRRGARHTGARTDVIATDAIDTVAGRALRRKCACRAIGLYRLWLITETYAIASAGIAFVVRVIAARDVFTYAVIPIALFRGRAGLAPADADVSATYAVDAIVGKALARRATRRAIVVAAYGITIAPSAIAFVIRIPFGTDLAAGAIDTAAFFRSRTCHAGRSAGRIATNAVGAIARGTLATGYARRTIGLRRLRLIAKPAAITFARIAFIF